MTSDSTNPPGATNILSLTDALERKLKPLECAHTRLEVDETNRKVLCKDCKREIDAFHAICTIAQRGSEFKNRWEAMRKDYNNLAGYVPHLRAVRNLESMWRGHRLPICPHCKKGITAEGLNKMGWVHRSYAAAITEHERETADQCIVTSLHHGPAA